jgi:hypothetical protein
VNENEIQRVSMKTRLFSKSVLLSIRSLTSLLLVASVVLLGGYLGTSAAQSAKPLLREQPNNVLYPLTSECENSWSLASSLNWSPGADWDFHLYTPNAHIYYANPSADGFILNQDANPACNPYPIPPEQITGMGQCGTYTLLSNLYSLCGGSPPVTFSASVTALKVITINGTSYNIGQTFHPQDGVSFTVACTAPLPRIKTNENCDSNIGPNCQATSS